MEGKITSIEVVPQLWLIQNGMKINLMVRILISLFNGRLKMKPQGKDHYNFAEPTITLNANQR